MIEFVVAEETDVVAVAVVVNDVDAAVVVAEVDRHIEAVVAVETDAVDCGMHLVVDERAVDEPMVRYAHRCRFEHRPSHQVFSLQQVHLASIIVLLLMGLETRAQLAQLGSSGLLLAHPETVHCQFLETMAHLSHSDRHFLCVHGHSMIVLFSLHLFLAFVCFRGPFLDVASTTEHVMPGLQNVVPKKT